MNPLCDHNTKHTERMIDREAFERGETKRIIVTWCAECGAKLRRIEINE